MDGGVQQRGGNEHEAGLFPEGLQTRAGEGQGAGRPGGGSQVRPAQDTWTGNRTNRNLSASRKYNLALDMSPMILISLFFFFLYQERATIGLYLK